VAIRRVMHLVQLRSVDATFQWHFTFSYCRWLDLQLKGGPDVCKPRCQYTASLLHKHLPLRGGSHQQDTLRILQNLLEVSEQIGALGRVVCRPTLALAFTNPIPSYWSNSMPTMEVHQVNSAQTYNHGATCMHLLKINERRRWLY
jgi:hypothetical protein